MYLSHIRPNGSQCSDVHWRHVSDDPQFSRMQMCARRALCKCGAPFFLYCIFRHMRVNAGSNMLIGCWTSCEPSCEDVHSSLSPPGTLYFHGPASDVNAPAVLWIVRTDYSVGGRGLQSLCGVCLPHVMCVCVCLRGCNYTPLCICVRVCVCSHVICKCFTYIWGLCACKQLVQCLESEMDEDCNVGVGGGGRQKDVCEQAHTRLKMWTSCVGRQRPQSLGGCLLKTAERGEQLSMAADHFAPQSAVDPPADNSTAALSPAAIGTRRMWQRIKTDEVSASFIITFLIFVHFPWNGIRPQMDLRFGGRIMLTEKRVLTACPNWYRSRRRESPGGLFKVCLGLWCLVHLFQMYPSKKKKTNKWSPCILSSVKFPRTPFFMRIFHWYLLSAMYKQ